MSEFLVHELLEYALEHVACEFLPKAVCMDVCECRYFLAFKERNHSPALLTRTSKRP